ncbi:microsomal glutathione S-transferase 1.2 [Poecilia latipinna]|nr:PREDICTED: microsomal glutathione S-transferase 1 [Poecilia formosa]XP_014857513.1 PREDICTED: microsomal glutathione S-transferase 1 [Poecilia mexicana]XP_014906784.1 PREDICTED: microsomal glutathione S-transferase 1 [Poecilia latipinna]
MATLMENEVFKAFASYAAIVTLKMMLMGPVTVYFRFTRGSFSNEEDVAKETNEEKKKKMLRAHPDVERAQRCHHNDLENIIPFFFIGLLYALSGPKLSIALIHFRVFTASRIFHSFAYILAFPQPSRALSYLLGMLTTFSMAFNLLITVFVL